MVTNCKSFVELYILEILESQPINIPPLRFAKFTGRVGQGCVEDGEIYQSIRGQKKVRDDGCNDVQFR